MDSDRARGMGFKYDVGGRTGEIDLSGGESAGVGGEEDFDVPLEIRTNSPRELRS